MSQKTKNSTIFALQGSIKIKIETMRNFAGVFYAIISSATFGLVPLFSIPLLHKGIEPPTILFYRMAISAVMMGVLAVAMRRDLRISFKDGAVLALLSVAYAGTAFGLIRSYDYIPSGVATTINFLYPLVVTVIMAFVFRERSSIWVVIAVVISLVGVALLSWGDVGHSNPWRGILFAVSTIFTYAAYIVGMMKSRAARLDSLAVTFYVLCFAAAIFLVYALSTSGVEVVRDWESWRNLLLLALLPTVLSNLTLVLAIKAIGSTMTSILGSMEPLTAVVVGVVHFGEKFSIDTASGLILVIVAVLIVILQSRHTKAAQDTEIPTQPQE